MNVTNATAIPTPGTPASAKSRSDLRGTAQREVVALVHTWKNTELAPDDELDLLRRIAAHGFASRMMAAHGANVARWVAILETLRELFVNNGDENDDDPDAGRPPHGEDWCPKGCKPMHGMKCGVCGHDGPGVWMGGLDVFAEYCCRHCDARTYQRPEGICKSCGIGDAETPDAPAGSVVDGGR